MADDPRLERIEDKLDKLGESVVLLARIDERQLSLMEGQKAMGERVEKAEGRIDKLETETAKAHPVVGMVKHLILVIIGAVIGGRLGH